MIPLIVDSFAGGGGASTGIEMALGRSPDIAINHNAAALAMHEANHPDTLHLSKNIWQVDPLEAVRGRPVGLAWFSPDCKHFSKAKGGKPVKRNVRDLAWTVVLWAKRARPAVIILENVEEFQDWGPLIEREKDVFVPCPDRRGQTFAKWIGELKRLGYRVEWRELVAADYGAPTTRKRFFLIARRDGRPIVWPAPTHGKPKDPDVIAGRKLPWRTAAEILDWSLPCPSIFETSAEILAKHGVRAVRPLAEATMARIARGTKRYVLDAVEPFVVGCGDRMGQSPDRGVDRPVHTLTAKADACLVVPSVTKFRRGATGHSVDEPLCTVTANSYEVRPGGAVPIGLIAPVLTAAQHGGSLRGADEPARTIAASAKDQHAVIVPSLVSVAHGDSGGRREYSTDIPLGAVTSGGGQHALMAPTLIQTGYGERENQAPRSLDIEAPLGTVVAGGVKHAVAAAFVSRQFGQSTGRAADEPLPTVTAEVNKTAVVATFLAQHNNDSRRVGGVNPGQPADRPVSTITATGSQQGVVAAHLTHLYTSNTAGGRGSPEEPLKTVTAGGGHAALVAAFMTKYYGEGSGQVVSDPFATVTTRDRFGLVTVTIGGADYVIDDIGLRMLTPRELFNAQGFPAAYQIDGIRFIDPETGRERTLSKAEQISCCGNSVCPPLAKALVEANCAHLAAPEARDPVPLPLFLEAAE